VWKDNIKMDPKEIGCEAMHVGPSLRFLQSKKIKAGVL
jgi:hypothetical protein